MISSRRNQKQIWADIEFIQKLEEIKAKKFLNNCPVRNLGELTKEIVNTESFKKIEDELIKKKIKGVNINIRMDGNFFR